MLWIKNDFGAKNERKKAVFCPLKIGKNIDDIAMFLKIEIKNQRSIQVHQQLSFNQMI